MPVVSLPVTFEDGDVAFYELTDFGGNQSSLVADPTDAANTVVQSLRPAASAECFAGTTVANTTGFTAPIPFAPGATSMNLRVWSPEAGTRMLLKVEKFDDPTVSVEAEVATTTGGMWEVLVMDFIADKVPGTADINFASEYTKASVFFDFTCGIEPPPPAPADPTYLWDDLAFGMMPPVGTELPIDPLESELTQNYPNPFSGATAIQFSLPAQSHVRLRVYNHLGQEVATLVDGRMEAGMHVVPFDASGLASGTYFYRLTHGSVAETRAMVLSGRAWTTQGAPPRRGSAFVVSRQPTSRSDGGARGRRFPSCGSSPAANDGLWRQRPGLGRGVEQARHRLALGEVGAIGAHADLFEHALGGDVGGVDEGDDAVEPEVASGVGERRTGGLRREALAVVRLQDGVAEIRRVQPLALDESREADRLAGLAEGDVVGAEAVGLVVREQTRAEVLARVVLCAEAAVADVAVPRGLVEEPEHERGVLQREAADGEAVGLEEGHARR